MVCTHGAFYHNDYLAEVLFYCIWCLLERLNSSVKHACEKIIVLFSNSDIFICVLITFSFPYPVNYLLLR